MKTKMNYKKLDLIYQIKWKSNNKDLPAYVKILNSYCSTSSRIADDVYIVNRKDFKSNMQLSDILFEVFNHKVSNFSYERAVLNVT